MDEPRIPLAHRLAAAPAPKERAAVLRMPVGALFDALEQMSGNRAFREMQEALERRHGDWLLDQRFCDAVSMARDMAPSEREDALYRLLAEPFATFWTFEDATGDSPRK